MKNQTSRGMKILIWILLATVLIQLYTSHMTYLTIDLLIERIEKLEQRNQ